MKKREFIALAGGVAAGWPLAAWAQRNLLTIGVLHNGSADSFAPRLTGLRQGLAEMGYAENRDYVIEYRFADNQLSRLPDLAADLVKRGVALIVAYPVSAASASKAATKDIPIVFGVGIDPVSAGLVNSLNHPGGNATGIYYFGTTLLSKRIALLREVIPTARRWGVLIPSGTDAAGLNPAADVARAEAETAMAALNLELTALHANANTNEAIDAAFAALAHAHGEALVVSASPFFTQRRVQIVSLATRDRVPTIYPAREFAEVGGLMSYGSNIANEFRKMGVLAGRILKGTKPADLPVEQSTEFEFVINLQSAKTSGIEVPSNLSARADEVIE
jgi:putative tryptophan/tyrosine transport system substrate-binding protein